MEEKNQTKTPKCPPSSVISQDATPHGIGALSPYSIAECLQDMMHLPAVKHLCFFLVIRREKKNQTSGTSLLEQSGIFFPAVLPVETWWLFFRDVVHMGRSRTHWRRVWGGSGWISSPLLSSRRPSALPMRLRSSSKSSSGGREYSGQERRCWEKGNQRGGRRTAEFEKVFEMSGGGGGGGGGSAQGLRSQRGRGGGGTSNGYGQRSDTLASRLFLFFPSFLFFFFLLWGKK